MAVNRDKSADHLTFSQRYGYDPLPEPMRLECLSDDLRREIWNTILSFLDSITSASFGTQLEEYDNQDIRFILGKILRKPEDEINTDKKHLVYCIKNIILKDSFNGVLDFLEHFLDFILHSSKRNSYVDAMKYINRIEDLFERYAAAYYLDISKMPLQFVPRGSKEQGEATQQAIETIQDADMDGASTHLRKAAKNINEGQFPDSVRESIRAVEAVARRIDSTSSTLGDALKSLKDKHLLTNTQLKAGFEKLYAYTNSEEGVRHALVFQNDAKVGVDEALFMYGACASFAAYLVSKHRQQSEKRESNG